MSVPALRFPEFEGVWEDTTLGDVAVFSNGKAHEKDIDADGQFVVVNSKFISTDGNIRKYTRSRICEIPDRSLVMVMSDIPRGKALAKCLFLEDAGIYSLNQRICSLSEKHCDNFFLLRVVNRNRYFLLFDSGVGQTNLRKQEVLDCPLIIPPLPEQKKIAAFLGVVDDKLSALISKRDLLGDYKRGLMQALFSQQIRFTDNNGQAFPDWEEKAFGEVFEYEQPTRYLVSSTDYSDDYKTPVLTAGKTFVLGFTNETNDIFPCETPVIIFDDFTTASKFVDFSFKAKSSAMKILKPRNSETPVRLYFELLNRMKSSDADHRRHWISEFQYRPVPIPHPDEQQKIADALSALDAKIAAVSEQVAGLDAFKKGLLQQMFV